MSNHHQRQQQQEEDHEEEEQVQEEVWEEMQDDGSSAHNNNNMELHEIWINAPPTTYDDKDHHQKIIPFRYKSISTNQLTPVDMNYSSDDSQYYDGTGTIVWMAALIFIPVIVSYHNIIPTSNLNLNMKSNEDKSKSKRICELGCGAGVAGMAIAKFTPRAQVVVFTDNDPKALELCHQNCLLNDLPSDDGDDNKCQCQFELLEWTTTTTKDEASNNEEDIVLSKNNESSFDTIIATDVLYEIIMIPPLLQTVSRLLKPNGYFWLSHVPRFYLPKIYTNDKDDDDVDENDDDDDDTIASQKLENYIIQQASKVGLQLIETIRPKQLYELATKTFAVQEKETNSDTDTDSNKHFTLEKLHEVHAVVFAFQKQQQQ